MNAVMVYHPKHDFDAGMPQYVCFRTKALHGQKFEIETICMTEAEVQMVKKHEGTHFAPNVSFIFERSEWERINALPSPG